jgi:hypothetical protein
MDGGQAKDGTDGVPTSNGGEGEGEILPWDLGKALCD